MGPRYALLECEVLHTTENKNRSGLDEVFPNLYTDHLANHLRKLELGKDFLATESTIHRRKN